MMKSKKLSVDIRGKNQTAAALAALLALYCLGTPQTVQATGSHADLPGPFTTVAQANLLCITCHEKQKRDVQNSTHWTWERKSSIAASQVTQLKKTTALTRFGLSASANPLTCRRCHMGIQPQRHQLSPTTPTDSNCLICHDTTGKYQPGIQGNELGTIVRSVGLPSARNCQSCHDQQCGLTPESDKTLTTDIHLQKYGFTCQSCHPSNGHHEFKRTKTRTTARTTQQGCISCHPSSPHQLGRLNQHAILIGCQSCHIPVYGNNSPAVLSWNWLLNDSREKLYRGKSAPLMQQGFFLAQDVTPLYFWDDGSEEVYSRGERIHPEHATLLQGPGKRTPTSKIMPFTVQYGTQMYDAKYRYLLSPELSGAEPPFFNTKTLKQSIKAGMDAIRLPYSGQYGITTTVMYRRLNHGVVATDKALGCMDCHGTNSIFNWQHLGYETDPWISESTRHQAPAVQDILPAIELPPIQESVLQIPANE